MIRQNEPQNTVTNSGQFPLSKKRILMSRTHRILLKIFQEPVYLKYPMDIALRTELKPELIIYAKKREGVEELIDISLKILIKVIPDCIEITKEEYESY